MTVLFATRDPGFRAWCLAFAAFARAFAASANFLRAASCFADGALLLRRILFAVFWVLVFLIVLRKIRATRRESLSRKIRARYYEGS